MIKYGLRAQLRTANLLTGQLYIVLDTFPEAPPVAFVPGDDPVIIPTIPGQLDQLQAQISSIVTKIEKIPFDQIGTDLRATLASTAKLMNRLDKDLAPEARAVLRQARQSLVDINNMLAPIRACRPTPSAPCRKCRAPRARCATWPIICRPTRRRC